MTRVLGFYLWNLVKPWHIRDMFRGYDILKTPVFKGYLIKVPKSLCSTSFFKTLFSPTFRKINSFKPKGYKKVF